jgi:uncharacterized protein (DUF433 family)
VSTFLAGSGLGNQLIQNCRPGPKAAVWQTASSAPHGTSDQMSPDHAAVPGGLLHDLVTGCVWAWSLAWWRRLGLGGRAARQVASASSLAVMELTSVIETRAGVRSGKPCFVGTRIAVYDVLDYLASGMTVDEIVTDFPELTADHVRAAIEFAAMRERRLATPA